MSANQTSNASSRTTAGAEPPAGLSSVSAVVVRVAGRVPTRVDLRFAGAQEQQLGLSLGTVLIYLSSHLTARTVALAWGEAAGQARSLSPVLPPSRRPSVVPGPWSLSALARFAGTPRVESLLMPARPGVGLPTMLRVQVGPVTWELADAAAYASLLRAWRTAADTLQIHADDE